MKATILGSGCPKCKKLFESLKKISSEIDKDIKVEYVTGEEGIQQMIELGVMKSPVLLIDEKIAFQGYDYDENKIRIAIMSAVKK